MYYGVRSANVVSYNGQFFAAFKEQHAICGMSYHVLHSNRYVAALTLVLLGTACLIGENITLQSS
jgi:hypothetical protein